MVKNTKKVYVCYNDKGETLYNKVTGTWNDGKGARNGSSVWTFSAKKPKEESKTIINAAAHLAKLGFENVTFALVEVALDEKGRASIITDEVPFGQTEDTTQEPTTDSETTQESSNEAVVECEPIHNPGTEVSDNE